MNEINKITMNSTLLYIIAFLLTTIIHEFMHAFTGWSFDSNPVLHHNYVEHFSIEHLATNQKALIALAGPVISLIQGILSSLAYLRIRGKSHKLIHLFLLWFSVLGFFNFLGYLTTGFLFHKGDIGKVYNLLNIPLWIQIFLAIIAALLLVYVAFKMTAPYLRLSYKHAWLKDGKAKMNFSFHVLFLPWLIGSLIITVLYLPVIALISIIYPIMSGMIFIFPWKNADSIKEIIPSSNKEIGKLSYMGLGALILLILLFKLVMAPGIEL
ncbi:hypothetical protein [uncultured Polaribacter sp.]|uniref:hypothetical protein n=1 Tax=uncultured Polaribacter sp. TaxID=174711 RepID=UPI002639C794|nr:hypothetical protein [uncultured Polaribacter sp.]